MQCSYCFYEDVSLHRLIKDYGFMSLETMKKLIDRAFELVTQGNIHFAFQGGEPTLIGLVFYEAFVNYVAENKTSHQEVTYSIQTNGTTINEKWASFFKAHHFLVGISIDGTPLHHDTYRFYPLKKETHKDIMAHLDLLKAYQVDTNVLSVVNNDFIDHVDEIYAYFKNHDLRYMQFIPVIPSFDDAMPYQALDHAHYEHFLKTVFDYWYEDIMNKRLTSIRYLDNMLLIYLGYEPESCDLKGVCSIQHVIEADGGIYPCDFYVSDNYRLGNVWNQSFSEILQSTKAKDFIDESLVKADECYTCPWFKLCRTGCKRRRTDTHKDAYCEVYKAFFRYADEKFKNVARMIEQGYRIDE